MSSLPHYIEDFPGDLRKADVCNDSRLFLRSFQAIPPPTIHNALIHLSLIRVTTVFETVRSNMRAVSSSRKKSISFLGPLLIIRVVGRTLHLLLLFSAATLLIGVRAWNLLSSRRVSMPRRAGIATQAFVPPRQAVYSALYSSRSPENGNPDTPEDDDAACVGGSDEEECEIDWSKMPGFTEGDDDNHVESAFGSSVGNGDEDFDELRLLLERRFQAPSAVNEVVPTKPSVFSEQSSSSSTMQSDWQRLEMMWQQREAASECDVYEPVTCGGHVCLTCSGSGTSSCRFCRGTKFLYLPITHDHSVTHLDDTLPQVTKPSTSSSQPFVSCSICHASGVETCRSCQGSGWIADWTQMGVRVGGRDLMPPPSAFLE
jgi:hypothetical protein